MTILAYALSAFVILMGLFAWALCRVAGQSDAEFEIDESQLEGDLRHELRDISFGGRG